MINSSQQDPSAQDSAATTIAGIDCGTNSIRLLIAHRQGDELYRTSQIIRLGEGVDAHGKLSAQALERLGNALQGFVTQMQEYRVAAINMIATSAVRDAENREEFFSLCTKLLTQVDPYAQVRLLSGDEEAQLTFVGATHAGSGLKSLDFPALVTDLGGGSTELALGDKQKLLAAYSMDMGCVRITEKFLFSSPPTEGEIAAASKYIDELIRHGTQAINLQEQELHNWIGVAGTFTTLGAIALGLPEYDSEHIHGAQLALTELDSHACRILHLSREERAALGVIAPGRVDVIGAGALIVHRLIQWMQQYSPISSIIISESDILDGIIYSMLESFSDKPG